MQIHELKPTHKRRAKKIVGRGGTRGKTSGRGTKGQNARSGRKKLPEMRTILKKLPKLRGYRFHSFQQKASVVNLKSLAQAFTAGAEVNPTLLKQKGLISFKKGSKPVVKILATGDITFGLKISGCTVSATAKDKILKAGGSVQ